MAADAAPSPAGRRVLGVIGIVGFIIDLAVSNTWVSALDG